MKERERGEGKKEKKPQTNIANSFPVQYRCLIITYFLSRGLCTVARSEAGLTQTGESGIPHQSHWLGKEVPGEPGQPSRSVAYYDAASLYPSSGAFIFISFLISFFKPCKTNLT